MGPSGSGKSTLLHCIAGLDRLTSGHVYLGDIDLSTLSDKELTRVRRDRVGFIFQTFNLIPTLNAIENITLPMPSRAASPTRPGSTASSTPCAYAIGSRTARRSCRAASNNGSPWRALADAARDHLRRRADRQPRLARERGDPRVHAARGAGVRPDDRHGDARPDLGVVLEPRGLPRRRPHRRRAARPPPTRCSARCASSGASSPCGRSRARALPATSCGSC